MLKVDWECKTHRQLVLEIKSMWADILKEKTEVDIDWTPGNASIEGNEIADRLAKEAAEEAAKLEGERSEPISQADVQAAARKSVEIQWQRCWEISDKGRRLFEYKHKVPKEKCMDFNKCEIQRMLLQLQSGHCRLREHMH